MERKRNKQNELVGEKTFDNRDYDEQSQMSQGIAEVHEQINDSFSSGNNDVTFLRDGKDLAKKSKK